MARFLAASTLIQRSRLPSTLRSGIVLLSAQARQKPGRSARPSSCRRIRSRWRRADGRRSERTKVPGVWVEDDELAAVEALRILEIQAGIAVGAGEQLHGGVRSLCETQQRRSWVNGSVGLRAPVIGSGEAPQKVSCRPQERQQCRIIGAFAQQKLDRPRLFGHSQHGSRLFASYPTVSCTPLLASIPRGKRWFRQLRRKAWHSLPRER